MGSPSLFASTAPPSPSTSRIGKGKGRARKRKCGEEETASEKEKEELRLAHYMIRQGCIGHQVPGSLGAQRDTKF